MWKWIRRVLLVILAVAVIGSGYFCVTKYEPWQNAKDKKNSMVEEVAEYGITANEAKNSIVYVYEEYIEGDYLVALGAPVWAIGTPGEDVEYFVTNGHVVEGAYLMNGEIQLYFDDNDYVIPEVVFYSAPEENDIAILKIPSPTDKRDPLIIRDSDTVEAGEHVFALGFPHTSFEVTDHTDFSTNGVTVTEGVIGKVMHPMGVGFDAFQMDVSIAGGNSGGPLIDTNGFAIGVNTLAHVDTDTMSFASLSNELREILEDNDIDYTLSEDYIDDLEDEAAAKNKKTKKKLDAAVDEAQKEFVLYGGITLVALALLLVVGFTGTKKVVVVGEKDDGKKAYLIGVTGQYAGKKYPLTAKTMTIGRDSNSCTLLFPDDTPGISSNHCSIYYDARTKSFVLTDNGSTYGTYLDDGRKLTQSVPETLLPGAGFGLADKTNTFKVDRE